MTCALWSALSYPANSFSFSNDRLTTTFVSASSRPTNFVGISLASGRYVFEITIESNNGIIIGVVDTSTSLNNSSTPPNWFGINDAGTIYYNNNGSLTTIGSVGTPSVGDVITFAFDTGAGTGTSGTAQAWCCRTSGGVSGSWNGSGTANPDTNVGGVACPTIATFTPVFQVYGSYGSVILNSGASAYAGPHLTTFANLPATLAVSIVKVMELGSPVQFTWTANDLAGLNYSLDGGAWTACTGTVTGASGTANGPTIDVEGVHHIQFQSAGQPLDETENITFAIVSKPSGAGSLLAANAASGFSGTTGAGATGALSSPTQAFIYKFYMDVNSTGAGVTGSPVLYVNGTDSSSVTFTYETNAGEWNSSGDNGMQGFEGLIPVSGPQYVQIGTSTTMSGTVTAADSGANTLLTGDITNNGTAATYSYEDSSLSNGAQFSNWQISIGVIYPFVDPTFDWYMGIWAPSAPETLTIDTGAYSPGTLSIGGECDNSTLGTLNISTDGGTTFHPATSLAGSTAYTATLAGTLSAGAYELQSEDAATSVVSNLYTLVVAAEAIELSTATGTLGGTLSLTGTYANDEPGGLNYSLDNGVTYEATTGYTPTGSETAGTWVASGGTLTEPGTLTVKVQDSTHTTIVSNPVTLVISEPAETITLTLAAGVAGGLLDIGGVTNAGPATAMNVSLNAGSTYSPVSSYSPGTGAVNAPFSGQGPILAPGDYEVMVQDAANPSIVSNIIPLVVTSKGTGGGFGVGVIPNWQAGDFLTAFLSLLPPGRAWPRWAAAVQTQVMGALVPSLVRVCQSAAQLLIDGFPATTVQLIPEWEASLGLPDACTPLGSTIAQQQAAILQKFTSGGSQSIPYYLAVAALLGYDITITEQAADTFTWTVNAAALAPPVLFRVGASRAGDSLEFIPSNAQLECVLQRLKPAHTTLIFNYT